MPITVQYEHTTDMSYDFALHYMKSRRLLRIGMWLIVVLIGMQVVRVGLTQPFDGERLFSAVLPILMIGVVWKWLIPYSMKWQLQRAEKGNKMGTSRTLVFQEEGVLVKTAQSEAVINYEGIFQLGESATSYFLYIGVNQALIVPKADIPVGQEQPLLDLLTEVGIPRQED